MFAQVQTNEQLHFNKPFILVTRVGNNEGNDTYRNPTQRYYEFDDMYGLYKYAARMSGEQKAVSVLRIMFDHSDEVDYNEYGTERIDYFHNFPADLDEYKRGIRVDM